MADLNFLLQADLDAQIINQFVVERADEDVTEILKTIEKQQIAVIKAKLKGRYDIDAIFNATAENRHYLIIKILSVLVVYNFIRRNAARKVPTDYFKEWEWAMKTLESIKAGKELPEGLPVAKDEKGNDKSFLMHGNNSNNDFYI